MGLQSSPSLTGGGSVSKLMHMPIGQGPPSWALSQEPVIDGSARPPSKSARERERELTCNLILEVITHHFCHFLEGSEYQGAGISGSIHYGYLPYCERTCFHGVSIKRTRGVRRHEHSASSSPNAAEWLWGEWCLLSAKPTGPVTGFMLLPLSPPHSFLSQMAHSPSLLVASNHFSSWVPLWALKPNFFPTHWPLKQTHNFRGLFL